MRVLYIEDNAVDADLTRRYFQQHHAMIDLDIVSCLSDGIAKLSRSHDYHLLLTDLKLPDGSGLEALSWVRQHDVPISVVILTGQGDEASSLAALKQGADEYVVKRNDYLSGLAASLFSALARFRSVPKYLSRHIRVLYVEHNPYDADLAVRFLATHAPYIELTLVQSASDVLSHLPLQSGEPAEFDLVLIDYRLPGKDGLELVRELRHTRQLTLPLVLITGQGSEDVIAQALHLGVDDFISKHDGYLYELAAFLEKVSRTAELRKEHRELLKLNAALRQVQAVFDSTSEGVLIADLKPRILTVNKAYTDITGYAESEVLGKNPGFIKSGRHHRTFYQTLWKSLSETGSWRGEIWNRRKTGEVFPQFLSLNTVVNEQGQATHYVGIFNDLSYQKESEQRLQTLTHYDPLTQLPNRLLLLSRIDHAIDQAEGQDRQVAVLYLDLDRFKNINDSYGHQEGDGCLKTLAKRLSHHLGKEDTLARMGGDEFIVVLEGISHPERAAQKAESLLELMQKPITLSSGLEVVCAASIGISLYPQDATTSTELIQYADTAMNQAKSLGRNTYRFFTEELTIQARCRLDLENSIRKALKENEFVLHYQPVIDAQSQRVVGAEALVRWHQNKENLLGPDKFIPVAEDSGLIIPLGRWVLRQACLQMRRWLDMGIRLDFMAVNLSGVQFNLGSVEQEVFDALQCSGLPPSFLDLELTESIIMDYGNKSLSIMNKLKEQGVSLSIDDFGTGYSSLAHLKNFPVDRLKIDKSFVQSLEEQTKDMAIVTTIINMAHNLGMKVVAEGVETLAQQELLKQLECEFFQGFYFSRALDDVAFVHWYEAHSSKYHHS